MTFSPEQVQRAVDILAHVRLGGPPLAELPSDCAPPDPHAAYRIQLALAERLDGAGLGPVVGHKIGCTTPVMQQFLGIDTPSAGRVHAARVFQGEAEIAIGAQHRIGVEVEIAVRVGRHIEDLEQCTPDRGAGAVSAVIPAIELVKDRYVHYPSLPAMTLVADDFFNWGAVLGPECPPPDFAGWTGISGALELDGKVVAGGTGAEILGHPMVAFAWLAGRRIRDGTPIRAGEFVSLGSVVRTHFAEAPQVCRAVFPELGSASAVFT